MQEKYNQQKLLNEKNQLKIENNTIIRNVLIILVVVFCLDSYPYLYIPAKINP